VAGLQHLQGRGERLDRAAGLGTEGHAGPGEHHPPRLRPDRHEPHRRRAVRRTRAGRRRAYQRAAGAGRRRRAERRILPPRGGAAMVKQLVTGTLAAALLSACMVGPDHVRPHMAVPQRFEADASALEGATDVASAGDAFLQGMGDPLLARLVDEALQANHDLRIALTRFDRADALLRGARFDALPTITAHGEAADVRSSADQAPGLAREARDGESWSAGVAASWELDLFG